MKHLSIVCEEAASRWASKSIRSRKAGVESDGMVENQEIRRPVG